MTEKTSLKINVGMTIDQVQKSSDAWLKKNFPIFDMNGDKVLDKRETYYLNYVQNMENKIQTRDEDLFDTLEDFVAIEDTATLKDCMHLFEKSYGKNILLVLDELSKEDSQYTKLIGTLRNRANNTNYIKNKVIAFDNYTALKSGDRDAIEEAIKQITVENVSDVYTSYTYMALGNKEKAKNLWDFFSFTTKRMRGANRPETVLQGIINNTILSEKEKRAYLNDLTNKLLKYAEKYQKTDKVYYKNLFDTKDNLINNCIKNENAYDLEEAIAKMLQWKNEVRI